MQVENINTGVIEHLIITLCLIVKYDKESSQRIFSTAINSNYGYYILEFLIIFLKNIELVNIEVYQIEIAKKKNSRVLGLLYRIESDAMSVKAQSYIQLIPQVQIVNESKQHVDNAKDNLAKGAIILLTVYLYHILDNKGVIYNEKRRNRITNIDE